jgi:hypothetical protein
MTPLCRRRLDCAARHAMLAAADRHTEQEQDMRAGQRVVVNQTPFEYMVPKADLGRSWQRFRNGIVCPEHGVRDDSVCVRWSLQGAHFASFRVKDILEHEHAPEDGAYTPCPACFALSNQVPMA